MRDVEHAFQSLLDRVETVEGTLPRAQAFHWLARMLDGSTPVLIERDGQVETHESFAQTVRRRRAQAYRDALTDGHSYREVAEAGGVTKGAILQALALQKRLDEAD